MIFEMKVSGIALDPFTNSPIVILKDLSGEKILPIWIGFMEASSIEIELEKTTMVINLNHEIIKNFF